MNLSADSAVARLAANDQHNLEKTVIALGPRAVLSDDLDRVYQLHREAIEMHMDRRDARFAAALFTQSRKHLLLGTLALFRFYVTSACRETRAAVEAIGIAYAIRRDAEKLRIFTEDDRSKAAAKKFKEAFHSSAIFPKDTPLIGDLKGSFDLASTLSHVNQVTLVRHLSIPDAESGWLSFRYQDAVNLSSVERYLLWMCRVHVAILHASDAVFPGHRNDATERFKKELDYIGAKVFRFSQIHRELGEEETPW